MRFEVYRTGTLSASYLDKQIVYRLSRFGSIVELHSIEGLIFRQAISDIVVYYIVCFLGYMRIAHKRVSQKRIQYMVGDEDWSSAQPN